MSGAAFNRGKSRQDYQTPADFIQAVKTRFGGIGFDLAASEQNKQARGFYSQVDDSLSKSWSALRGITLWLNPPFDNIAPWAKKCCQESEQGAKILFLVPASVGSEWFSKFVFEKSLVLFLSPRLSFDGKQPYPKDCILACYGYGTGFNAWRWK